MTELYDMALPGNGEEILTRELSPIHGYGLFTNEDLPVHTIICRRMGLRSTLSKRDKRAIIGIDGIDAAVPTDIIFKSINHSCVPNCDFTDTGCLINLLDIPAGHEITVDYSSMLCGSSWTANCMCGMPCCLHIIRAKNA